MIVDKTYLGDSVYCQFDGFGFVLTTENGREASNRIVLELWVYEALARYVDYVKEAAKRQQTPIPRPT